MVEITPTEAKRRLKEVNAFGPPWADSYNTTINGQPITYGALKELAAKTPKRVYIAHPISGNVQSNLDKVRIIYRRLALGGEVIPVAPFFLACLALHDGIPSERMTGIAINRAYFEEGMIDELWIYGDRISPGVSKEIELADKLGIPVHYKANNKPTLDLSNIELKP